MTQGPMKRKLTAIMSADVEGYSRLMNDDEIATIETLKSYREMMTQIINGYGGRVVDSPGDNLLAEFNSVVDAVACGVKIQQELKKKNSLLPQQRRMQFRIGVNLGDVIADEDRIYGDGVNIAARIERLAQAGGICISGTAYDQIKNKLGQGFEYLGERSVKNIREPVRVYRVLMEPEAAGKIRYADRRDAPGHKLRATMLIGILALAAVLVLVFLKYVHKPLPSAPVKTPRAAEESKQSPRPAIAVLPFNNMSGDPGQEYLSDGITENIITALSKVPRLLVIARNSTFTYKGTAVNVQQVAKELGVQYVLEGSVQKSKERVRITAQLIDARSGQHLWAERYDRELKDIFALQDEITMKIMTALQVKLSGSEKARVIAKGTNNLEAYLKLLKGYDYFRRLTTADTQRARGMAAQVITLDPDYPGGYYLMARTYLRDAVHRKNNTRREAIDKVHQLASKILELDPSNVEGHVLLGNVYFLRGQKDMAIEELEKALSLDPNSPEAVNTLGRIFLWSGSPKRALDMFQRAARLDPLHARRSYKDMIRAYRIMGRYEEAISLFREVSAKIGDTFNISLDLIACYTALGMKEEAQSLVREFLERKPDFSIRRFARGMSERSEEETARFIELLRKAGLPEQRLENN
ncbi:MAG: tetratricopeptide repeat protein [Deltaproteobacteria bacterium]|nr:tetratricopeptide repeat protein [Deltaproteobacteria bacterium]MBW2137185.1 tetratricopeptide repeat protein [Deltaproteobacteria bacterium]